MLITRLPATLLLPLVLLLLLAACGSEEQGTPTPIPTPETAARLVLTPDASSGSEAALVARLARLEVIVDAAGGLAGISAGPLPGGGTAEDWDDDGELEARFTAKVEEALPVLQIGLSRNSARELTFRVIGYGEGDERVMGQGLARATIAEGEVRRVGTSFSLAPWARPPRVVMFRPADGTKVPQLVRGVTAVLSTAVDAKAVASAVTLTETGSGATVPIEVKTEEATVATDGAFGTEQRTVLSLTFDALDEGLYQVRIGPGIVSQAGERFDQDPTTPKTEDPFISRFEVEMVYGGGPEPCDACPPGWGCQAGFDGCLPILDCADGCGEGYLCDTEEGECVADCRPLGFCFAAKQRCDSATGFCGE